MTEEGLCPRCWLKQSEREQSIRRSAIRRVSSSSREFPRGEYRIIPRLAGFEPHRPKYKAVVAKGGCDEIHIGMWTDSSLS